MMKGSLCEELLQLASRSIHWRLSGASWPPFWSCLVPPPKQLSSQMGAPPDPWRCPGGSADPSSPQWHLHGADLSLQDIPKVLVWADLWRICDELWPFYQNPENWGLSSPGDSGHIMELHPVPTETDKDKCPEWKQLLVHKEPETGRQRWCCWTTLKALGVSFYVFGKHKS